MTKSERNREYYERNRDRIREQQREYYEANAEQIIASKPYRKEYQLKRWRNPEVKHRRKLRRHGLLHLLEAA